MGPIKSLEFLSSKRIKKKECYKVISTEKKENEVCYNFLTINEKKNNTPSPTPREGSKEPSAD